MLLINTTRRRVVLLSHKVDRDLFARIATALSRVDVQIPAHFSDTLVPRAFSRVQMPVVHARPVIFDWKEAMKPLGIPRIHNIMSYRSFQFVKKDDHVLLYYKQNSLSPIWLGIDGTPDEGLHILSQMPDEQTFVAFPIPPCSVPLDELRDLQKFFPFLRQSSISFWEEFVRGPQLDESFGTCDYLDDFWVSNRIRDLSSIRQLQLPPTTQRLPPPLTLRVTNTNVANNLDKVNTDDFIVGNMCIIDGEPEDETFAPNLWIAKIIEVHIEEEQLTVTYYQKQKNNDSYKIIDASKTYRVAMACVLIPGFALTKKQTLPKKIEKNAFAISQARLVRL
jgi:hypothetical protein